MQNYNDNQTINITEGREKVKVGIDFDGVLMALFMGRTWVFTENATSEVRYVFFRNIRDWISSVIAYLCRKKQPDVENAIKVMYAHYDLYLLTSRRSVTKSLTMMWLKKEHLARYFKNYYFRDENITPVEHKKRIIERMGFDYHIDDSITVVDILSRELPEKQYIHFFTDGKTIDRINVIPVRSWGEVTKILTGKI